MNERIRELYRQANEQAHQQACEKNKTLRPQNNTVWNEFVPLFAELIVRECADICNKIYFDRYPDAEDFERSEEGDAIKEHFGVKE